MLVSGVIASALLIGVMTIAAVIGFVLIPLEHRRESRRFTS